MLLVLTAHSLRVGPLAMESGTDSSLLGRAAFAAASDGNLRGIHEQKKVNILMVRPTTRGGDPLVLKSIVIRTPTSY